MVPRYQETIRPPEGKCRHDEQVASTRCRRHDWKERSSDPVTISPPPGHVLCNARLAHVDAELEQFAVDAGRAPERVGQAHVPDHRLISSGTLGLPPRRLDFQRQNDRNPARCQRTTVSGRTMASASTMPGARRYSPTNTNRSKVPENRSLRGIAPQHIDLLPENQDFRLKPHLLSEISWSVQSTAV